MKISKHIPKYIILSIAVFSIETTNLYGQAAQLATSSVPVSRQVPELTGNADKDAEIQLVRANDLARFEMHRLKIEEVFGGSLNAAQKAYLKSVGLPEFVYTGNADGDFERFKAVFRAWISANETRLPAIQQQLAALSK
jgi:hypothetical protein